MKTLITLGILVAFSSFIAKDRLNGLGFLAGTWKTENKENYESWKGINDSLLEGNGYKMKAGQKVVTEYFSIKAQSGKIDDGFGGLNVLLFEVNYSFIFE
jgi:hypothetical protein